MSLPKKRKMETELRMEAAEAEEQCSLQQMQSLLSLLKHLSCCVRPGRIFLNRMLNELRVAPHYGPDTVNLLLSVDFKPDVRRWATCIHVFNSVSIMAQNFWANLSSVPMHVWTGAADFVQGNTFTPSFPQNCQFTSRKSLPF